MEKKHYFILRSLVTKYGKDSVINTVNKIVINNVKKMNKLSANKLRG
ncbi:hypothetical protein [Spiroplasma sp. SV19]|nr:hypothetical protein [Spiroplasma sp. SV19]